MFPPTRTPFLK